MRSGPRVVFGMPAYNRPDSLPETLESILGQTCREFALVIVDDSPSDASAKVVETYAGLDPRISYERNPVRLGMIGNWRKCFERARERYPDSEYFAWVSDHDVWHPRWLEVLVATLDAHPEVALAYPITLRTYEERGPKINRTFDTFGVASAHDRLRQCSLRMVAGNMIYGLFRAKTLAQAGVFRAVLLPDRQVLLELSLLGQFKCVHELLWYREIAREFSFKRQRAAFFPGGVPLYTYLPAHLTHFAILIWDLAVRGRGRPAVGRLAGLRGAGVQLRSSVGREMGRVKAPWLEQHPFVRRLPFFRTATPPPEIVAPDGAVETADDDLSPEVKVGRGQ